jgi:hypothetical protein
VPLRNLALASILLVIVAWFPYVLRCQTTAPSNSALTNQDVIDLLKAGFSPDIVLAKIRSSLCRFDTSLAAMKTLKNAGVPDSVVLAMVQVSPARDQRPPKSSYPTMQEVLDKSVQALGGEDAIRKLNSTYVGGTFEDHGKTGTLEMYLKAPNKSLVVRRTPGSETRVGFDGNAAWSLSPPGPAQQFTGQELGVAAREADYYQSVRLAQLYPRMALVSGNSVGERPVYTIQADPGDGTIRRMYFDVDTGLLLQNDLEYETSHGHVFSTWRFEDYRAVDGVQVAFIRRNLTENYTIRVSEVRHDVPIDDGGFAKPIGSAMSAQAAAVPPPSVGAPSTTGSTRNPPSTLRNNVRDDTVATSHVETVAAVSHESAPPPVQGNVQISGDGKIRIYVSDSESWEMVGGWGASGHQNSDGSGGFSGGGHMSGGARPQTAEIMKTFNQRCPEYTITNNRDRADFAVILDHEGGKGLVRRRNKIAVFDREGDSIFTDSTRELGNSVKDACTAISQHRPIQR